MRLSEIGLNRGGAAPRVRRFAFRLFAAALLVLGACQDGSRDQKVAQKPAGDPDWWLDSLNVARDHLADAVLGACPQQGFLSTDKCVREKIVKSFSTQGSAHMRCDMDEPTGGFLLCADLFAATERTYILLGLDPKAEINSDDPYDSLAEVSQLVATRVISKCGEAGPAECISGEFANIFAVDRSSADRCVISSETRSQVHCALGLIRIQGYEKALLYFR